MFLFFFTAISPFDFRFAPKKGTFPRRERKRKMASERKAQPQASIVPIDQLIEWFNESTTAMIKADTSTQVMNQVKNQVYSKNVIRTTPGAYTNASDKAYLQGQKKLHEAVLMLKEARFQALCALVSQEILDRKARYQGQVQEQKNQGHIVPFPGAQQHQAPGNKPVERPKTPEADDPNLIRDEDVDQDNLVAFIRNLRI